MAVAKTWIDGKPLSISRVRTIRRQLDQESEKLRELERVVRDKQQLLQSLCTHPDIQRYKDITNTPSSRCPDCGLST